MAIQRQPPRTMPLTGSVDLKTHPHLLQPPDFSELINADLDKTASVSKRRGYAELGLVNSGLNSNMAGASSMQAYKGEPLIGVKSGARYGYDRTTDDLVTVGSIGAVTATAVHRATTLATEVFPGSSTEGLLDYAICGEYEGLITRDQVLIVRHRVTEVVMYSLVGTATAATRVIRLGDRLCFVTTGGANVTVRFVNTLTWVASATNVAGDAHAATHSLDVTTDDTFLYIAYKPAAANLIKVIKVSSAGAVAASGTFGGDPGALAIFYSAPDAGLTTAWYDLTTLQIVVLGWTTGVVAQNTHNIGTPLASGRSVVIGLSPFAPRVRVYWTDGAALVSYRECNRIGTTSGSTQRNSFNTTLGSKPIRLAAYPHDLIVLYQYGGTSGQVAFVGASCMLCRVTDLPGGFDPINVMHAGAAFAVFPTVAQMVPALIQGPAPNELLTATTGIGQAFADGIPAVFSTAMVVDAHTGIYADPLLYLRGGSTYGGLRAPLCGFCWAPEIVATASAAGGSLTATGTYSYIAVYESTDETGTVHRSAPSLPKSVVIAAGQGTANVTVRTILDRRHIAAAPSRITLYRTASNGTIYYRLTAVGPTAALSFNDISSTVTFADTEADATLTDNEILYTQGGAQLANYPMPPGPAVELHDTRIWAGADDGSVWFSKTLLAYEAAAFHPAMTIDTRGLGQPIAMVSAETAMILFWREQIGYVYGQGPNDAGQGNGYTPVQLITGNTLGTANPRSVIRTPVGVMFEASVGICMLPPGGGVPIFIGARIEDKRAGQTIVGAEVLADRECVAFTCETGLILNYWYTQNRWSWDVTIVAFAAPSVVAACMSDGRHTMVTSTDKLVRQRDATYYDATVLSGNVNTFIPTTITTGWTAFDGLQGLVRLWDMWLLGVREDGCDALLQIWVDRNDAGLGDLYGWNITLAQPTNKRPVELRAHMKTQQLEAMKFRIQDVNSSGNATTGQGMTWTGVRIGWGGTGRGPRLGRGSAAVL